MVPVRIALLGFSRFERATFESFFRLAGKRTPAYVYTTKVSDCDFLVADADDLVACATVRLSGILHRTVMLGNKAYPGAALQLPRPINLMLVIRALDAQPKKAAPPAVAVAGAVPAAIAAAGATVATVADVVAVTTASTDNTTPPIVDTTLSASQVEGSTNATAPTAAAPTTAALPAALTIAAALPHAAPQTAPLAASSLQVLGALAARSNAPPPHLDARALFAERAAWQETFLRKNTASIAPLPAAESRPAPVALPSVPTPALPKLSLVQPPAAATEPDTIPSTFDELEYAEAQCSGSGATQMDHILVVDDSDIALRFMTNNLQRFGFQVHLARSGQDAIERVSKRHFEFVFMDVMMEGLDGFQTCKAIKRSTYPDSRPPPTVVMLTSRGTMVDKMRGTMAGCDAYLTKPLIEVELLKIIGDREIARHDYADTASDATMMF